MSTAELVVDAEHLTRRFGPFVAVDDVTLRVPRGSIFGFLGPSGSGKTTTIRMLCGLLKPTEGRAVVSGYDIEREPERLRQNLGYMSQRFSLYADLTVEENLEFYGGVYGVAPGVLQRRIKEVCRQLDFGGRIHTLTADLPLGWKQRVALAAAMLHQPPVLFLDEPTSGVDPASRRLFWEILDDLAADGTSIFVSTHAMDEVERCDLVGVMYRARLIATDSPLGLRRAFAGRLFHLEAEPLLKAVEVAQRLPGVQEASLFGSAVHVTTAGGDGDELRRRLEAGGVVVHSLHATEPTLEDVFVQLIAHGERRASAAGEGSVT